MLPNPVGEVIILTSLKIIKKIIKILAKSGGSGETFVKLKLPIKTITCC